MQILEYIEVEAKEQIGFITLNRPEARNALDEKMLDEIEHAYVRLEKDTNIRIIVFQGAGGRAFAAGADIKALAAKTPLDGLISPIQPLFNLIEQSTKVTIAIIDGYALGGGCELAMACDIRIATDHAKLGLPELNLGLLPGAGGTQRLARLVGKGRALDLILTGRILSGEEACNIGLASYFCTREDLKETLEMVTKSILTKGPIAVHLAKQSVHNGYDLDLKSAQWIERLSLSLLLGTEDKTEGTQAFIEKRPAHFTNK
ncbi:enoyl-CoA hydratase/isomerase family protein [Paenibacillus sp.]